MKTTKHSLLMSITALILCASMLIGTTFAWFTDTVVSSGNKIQSGTLKVDLELLDKTGAWKSLKGENENPIFDYDKWEPGFTDIKILKIENEGTLALKWVAQFVSSKPLSDLANVIDVYVKPSDTEFTYPEKRDDLTGWTHAGTVADFVNTIETTTNGTLEAKTSAYLGIALKMQESAGNTYQGLDLGGAFDIRIFATQLDSEKDSIDNKYDANAPKMFTVDGEAYDDLETALLNIKDNSNVAFSGVTTPLTINNAITLTLSNTNITEVEDGVNAITVNADATIIVEGYNNIVGGKGADGIKVAADKTLTLKGSGTLVTKGNGGFETQAEYNAGKGGSGIDVEGNIVIDGLDGLIAEGYGKHAFGIGGATKSIKINNSTVRYAKGGMVDTKIGTNYGKKDNEAGAAIGSSTDGAVIEINNSTVINAEGGSKAAGIGAMYHTGVTVKITDSDVTAYGGSSSAGIGGSRVEAENDKITPEQTISNAVTVEITNSKVTAVGGDFGAGIGSGYDTYCKHIDKAPLNTVKIDAASDITAQGGWLGAGIGTGHNVINFVGDIKCDTSKVKAGNSDDPTSDPFNCCWGMPTTIAENVGLGVYNIKNCLGVEPTKISTADDLVALGNKNVEGVLVLTDDIDLNNTSIAAIGAAYGKELIIFGNGHKISNANLNAGTHNGMNNYGLFYAYTNSTLTISNLMIENVNVEATASNYGAGVIIGYMDGGSNVTLNNIDVKNCTVKNSYDEAAVYVGYQTGTLTMVDCDSTGCAVEGETATKTGAFIGHVNGNGATLENCTTDLTINATNRNNGTLVIK